MLEWLLATKRVCGLTANDYLQLILLEINLSAAREIAELMGSRKINLVTVQLKSLECVQRQIRMPSILALFPGGGALRQVKHIPAN